MDAKIRIISYVLPERAVTSYELEDALRDRNPSIRISSGIIESTTGITSRRFSKDDEYNSHLAARAAAKALEDSGLYPEDIDLLIFASAGQDLLEPATGHIVQDMLGTNCRVFDITNACNSFLNALEVADSLIASGAHQRVLIATGEVASKSIKWDLINRSDFKKSFAGYTLGDAGAAAIIEKSDGISGIVAHAGMADSKKWEVGTLPGGGSRHPRGDEWTYFQGNGSALKEAFENIGPEFLERFLSEQQVSLIDISRIYIHQVSIPYLDSFINALGISSSKVIRTVSTLGNIAAATIPVALCLSDEDKPHEKGDLILLIGLAGGISLEAMLVRW